MKSNPLKLPQIWLSAFLMVGAATPVTVFAQTETYEAIARVGGQAQALAELCANMTRAELDARKKEQSDAMAKRGISAARFATLFDEGYAASKAKIAAASPEQRAEGCKQLMSGGKKR